MASSPNFRRFSLPCRTAIGLAEIPMQESSNKHTTQFNRRSKCSKDSMDFITQTVTASLRHACLGNLTWKSAFMSLWLSSLISGCLGIAYTINQKTKGKLHLFAILAVALTPVALFKIRPFVPDPCNLGLNLKAPYKESVRPGPLKSWPLA
jgi:hypothetical protein